MNARTRLRTLRPSRPQTGHSRISKQKNTPSRLLTSSPDPKRASAGSSWCSYLHGLVVPAVRPVFVPPASMQHQQRPVGVSRLQATGVVQANQTQAALQQCQRLTVDLICTGTKRAELHAEKELKRAKNEERAAGKPFVSSSLAAAHSDLPSEVRTPTGGSLSSAFSDIVRIFSSCEKISISLSCLLFATTSNTKNYRGRKRSVGFVTA